MSIEQYLKWQDFEGNEFRPVSLVGVDLLNDRILNKGTAFSEEERAAFHLDGLVPPRVQSFEDQLDRVYQGYLNIEDDIQKYIFLRSLQDRNETLFYALVAQHVEEMAPIIYTPTVGRACQEFSHRYQKPRGMYITPENVESMGEMVHHFPSQDIKIIVVTDSQGILGIGDQGVGGMGIPIGKLSLYTLGAGIHPACCLPIALDIGTNNDELLNDPMYLGIQQKRISGKEYDLFIEKFVAQVKRYFPRALLQWEDFSKSNAFNNLHRYVDQLPSFNDDIQGTGAVVLAGIINGVKIKKEKLSDQTYLVYGAGAGGVGVADQICAGLVREGLELKEAQDKIFILDSRGLVFEDRADLDEYKKSYAKPLSIATGWDVAEEGKASLTEVINNVEVTVLLGTCGVGSSFKEGHIKKMLSYTERPIVFPLSNPTSSCEALPEDLYAWSNGKAIVATGSPFNDVTYGEQLFRIGQGNNVFIFPGVGLAAILTKIQTVTVNMFTTASYALADCVAEEDLEAGTVFPKIKDLQEVSLYVAIEVIKEEIKDDVDHELHTKELAEYVEACMWKPTYLPYRRV
ncbi:MAG: NAD-dependent malic enzyme [Desulfobulbaceae bacterium]|nr:NAD-dependent malic enzyme [Desulfobulbaceae bacterium]